MSCLESIPSFFLKSKGLKSQYKTNKMLQIREIRRFQNAKWKNTNKWTEHLLNICIHLMETNKNQNQYHAIYPAVIGSGRLVSQFSDTHQQNAQSCWKDMGTINRLHRFFFFFIFVLCPSFRCLTQSIDECSPTYIRMR